MKLIIALLVMMTWNAPHAECYDAWNSDGLHLVMHDNGTPEDYADDWVIDWEDNRSVYVKAFD